MSYSNLSQAHLEFFWKFVRGDVPNDLFEEKLYGDHGLESTLGVDEYLNAISLDFHQENDVSEFKRLLARVLPTPANCTCHTKSDQSFVTLGDWSEEDFDIVQKEVDGVSWLYRMVCKTCKTSWLVAVESLIYDLWILVRGVNAKASNLKTYRGLLASAAATGAFFRYVDPMNSLEIPAAIKALAEETPGMSVDEIASLLPVSTQVVQHHAQEVAKQHNLRIELGS